MAGLTPPAHGAWTDNNGKPIYFDSIDNSGQFVDHFGRASGIPVCNQGRRSTRHRRQYLFVSLSGYLL